MKNLLLIYIVSFAFFSAKAQNLYLKAEGSTMLENKVIDSVPYNKIHGNAKSVADEAAALSNTLLKNGYLENRELAHIKTNDSTFVYSFSVGQKTNTVHIYTGHIPQEEKDLLDISKDTIILAMSDVEPFMNSSIALLERKGYSLSSLQLTDYSKTNNTLTARLNIKTEKKRTLDNIVIEGYPKFPEGIRRNIAKQYRGKTFNQETLQRVYNDFNSLRFVSQVRYPEILFKKDTTKVYVYLQKARPNTFDGFIGFSNDEQSNVIFNGYLDLNLSNVLNSGEKFNLFWKSDGQKQTTFNLATELPYLFRSPVGLKASLRIFKQDSTFQNTVTDVNVGYYFSYNSKLYIGHQKTQSVDIQNSNTATLSDYSNTFWTSSYEFTDFNVDDFLFPERTSLTVKGGLGKRNAKTGNSDQYFAQINASHNLYLNKKNVINVKNHTYYLKSNTYIINELYRFGGINSIRGFNENSLQASLYTALMAEYRYILSPTMYVHSITDYGYFQDKASGTENKLLGLGFGFGLFTKTGLFNIIYANGSTESQQIKLSNSIVHISFKTSF
ncbi:hypothetical protein HYN59_01235 [Flavobacterium album]|uniref:Bacterial surface antigen (D15) domain-containing protein n=1 Tax=Flavobacterium album TaxID=2175091 RepID=A0A2S1QTT7_9FLAO|nr:hypothetical protein [Flavobacterium album]AWH83822.1 hypothetical protein HYN59_01235 [Flavobacterium album]